ncbi:ImmA/IrrE family metallo-endopeptidase [Oenococcus sp. UCMA 16435]|nr:ImmA/IrrE family metallo-endopeptidase [Oenococcus sp. UCMA 16435]MDI4584084.1 ImmA/IrrE family metallo-endopeptidase [Oenococcus sp. UCMA 14587]
MTPIEKIIDLYSEYKFYQIEVKDPKYHDHIQNDCIYINSLQSEEDQATTLLHELIHATYDSENLEKLKNVPALKAEHFARHIENREIKRYLA